MTEATASTRVRRWGVRVRGPHRAIPARAPRPLLPDARLVRRGRGRGPGDVPAGVAGARDVRRQLAGPCLAVPDRDQRLPRRAAAERPTIDELPHVRRGAVADALPRPPARRDRARRRRARRRRRRTRDDRARVPRRAPGAAAAPARDAHRARHPGLARDRHGVGARRPLCRPSTAPSSGRARRCRRTSRRAGPSGRRASRAPRNAPCSTSSSTRTNAAMRPSPCPSRPRTCESRCRPPRCSSRASRSIAPLLENALREGDWRLRATVANRMPTAASYRRAPGDTIYRAFKFDVLRVVDGKIAEITTFGPELFPEFGLPATL